MDFYSAIPMGAHVVTHNRLARVFGIRFSERDVRYDVEFLDSGFCMYGLTIQQLAPEAS